MGGDEFTVLLLDCTLSDDKRVAEKIIDAVAAMSFDFGGSDYGIGASIGITSVSDSPRSPEVITGEADAPCYSAKGQGRGRAIVYDGTA